MKPYKNIVSNIAPLDIPNVDTDQIIPKQFLKRIERTGFGQFLFFDWRFNDDESENKEFILNKEDYRDANILISKDNFGCGSSREHAPWALLDYGYNCIIAPSFADIFYNNCFQNGILPIKLDSQKVDELFEMTAKYPQAKVEINLEKQVIIILDENVKNSLADIPFEIPSDKKEKLIKGLDDIGWTLQFEEEITAFEKATL